MPVNDRVHRNYAIGRKDSWDTNWGTYIGGGNLYDGSWSRTVPDSSSPAQNPKWRSKVAKHISATTPYSRSVGRLVPIPGTLKATTVVPPVRSVIFGSGQLVYTTDNPLPVGQSKAGVLTQAYLSWVKKANKELRTIQSGVSLGELRETLHAIRHPAEALKQGLADWIAAAPKTAKRILRTPKWGSGYAARGRKSDRRRAKALAQALSGSYLEHANGWGPLVMDIDNAARTAAEFFARDGISYRRISASASENWSSSSSVSGSYVDPALKWKATRHYRYESSCRIVGEIIVRHTGSAADFRSAAGLNLREFVPTVWELIPLSYVGDYFMNLGAILESLAFTSSARAWWSWSEKNTCTLKVRASATSGATGNPGGLTWYHTSFNRTNPDNFTPSLSVSLPDSHLFRKLANVSSLGIQALTSSRLINRLIHG